MSFQFSGSCILFTTARVLLQRPFGNGYRTFTQVKSFSIRPPTTFSHHHRIYYNTTSSEGFDAYIKAKCNRSYVKRILFTSVTVCFAIHTDLHLGSVTLDTNLKDNDLLVWPDALSDIRLFTPMWQRRSNTDAQQKYPVRILTSFSNCLRLSSK